MKEKLFPVILSALLMTACSSANTSDMADTYSVNSKSQGAYYSYEAAADYESYDYDTAEVPNTDSSSNNPEIENGLTAGSIKKEMLVYSCNMSIDVLNFDEALTRFKEQLNSCGGFVETENYSNGGSSSRWYYEDEEKWQSYSATVRIPSAEYDNFCNEAAKLGDLRNKNASVENLSSEYYDLATSLEIYEAKEERYIALLADISDDEYAVTVERELTDLQIQIAQIKTRMNDIKTDVAYSYVNISINEVKEYHAEPIKTDTFGQRLSNTISETASDFLIFLEEALFILIHLLPYLVLIGIIVVIVIAVRKKSKAKKAAKVNAETKNNGSEKDEEQK